MVAIVVSLTECTCRIGSSFMLMPVVGMWLNLWPQNITKKVNVYNQEPIELRRLNVLLVQRSSCEWPSYNILKH